MTYPNRLRRAATVAGGLLLGLLLSGCMLTSEVNLVDPSEGQGIFEEGFVFDTYSERDGVLVLSEDDSSTQTFAYANGGYVSADGVMTAYFLPPPDGGDYYMLAIVMEEGTMYGTMHRDRSGVTELRLVFDAELAAVADRLPPGVEIADGGIAVSNRADLDAIIPLIANGTLPTGPLVVYLGGDEPPRTVLHDGSGYRPGD